MSFLPSTDIFPEQSDLDRLLYLYSENSAKEEDTLKFWRRALFAYCLQNQVVSFEPRALIDVFTVSGCVPNSLAISLPCLSAKANNRRNGNSIESSLLRVDSLKPFDLTSAFLSTAFSITSTLLPFVAVSPIEHKYACYDILATVANEVFSFLEQSARDNDIKFIYLLKNYLCSSDDIAFPSVFLALSKSESLTPAWRLFFGNLSLQDSQIISDYLVHCKLAVVSDDGSVLKLLPRVFQAQQSSQTSKSINASSRNTSESISVSAADVGKLQVILSINRLEGYIDTLERKSSDCTSKALNAKRMGDPKKALFHLALRKNNLAARDKMMASLLNLIAASQRIEEAKYINVIVEAYNTATNALRTIREQSGITVDSVDESIASLEEEMEYHKDIDSSISAYAQSQVSPDEEDELSKELDALMATESKSINQSANQLQSLPVAPSHTIIDAKADNLTEKEPLILPKKNLLKS